MTNLKVLDLFSGIGGFSLGLERTGGFETVAFCEIEEFPRNVIKKHWPDIPCYRDIRELTAERLVADGIAVDGICGGFPCQDISVAGKGGGLLESEADYSLKSPVLLANFDPDSSSWRTSARCFVEGWMPFSEPWPRSGMMQSGTVYQLPTLASLTDATGFGLLPTLGKNEPKGAGRMRFRGSTEFRGAKMSEGLRTGPDDPIYLHPAFAEEVMGFPIGWTELPPLETP